MTIIELNDKNAHALQAHDRKAGELDKRISSIAAAANKLADGKMTKEDMRDTRDAILTDLGVISQIASEMAGVCYDYSRLLTDIARTSEISWPPSVKSIDRKAGT